MNKLDISVIKQLIKLRNRLDAVSQISWSFSLLNKQHPIAELTNEDAAKLIETYQELLDELRSLMKK